MNGAGKSDAYTMTIVVLEPAPTDLLYPKDMSPSANPLYNKDTETYSYTQGVATSVALTPIVTGHVTSCSIYPSTFTATTGLSFATSGSEGYLCSISGNPSVLAPSAVSYNVTAGNTGMCTSSNSGDGGCNAPAWTIIKVAVLAVKPTIAYGSTTYNFDVLTEISENSILPTSNTGGDVVSYAIAGPGQERPRLPPGMYFNTDTGAIGGTPIEPQTLLDYTITASNSGGTSTFSIKIKVTANNVIIPSLGADAKTDLLKPGNTLVANAGITSYMSAAAMGGGSKVLTCFANEIQTGKCTINGINGYTIIGGSTYEFNPAGTTTAVAVASFSTGSGIVCFVGDGGYVNCDLLAVSDTITKLGTTLAVNQATSNSLALVSLDGIGGTSHAMVCYANGGKGNAGTCKVIDVTAANSLEAGTAYEFNVAGAAYVKVTTLSNVLSIVCYADGSDSGKGKCNLLSVSGKTITKEGAVTFSNSRVTEVALTMLNPTTCIVCYVDTADSHGTCNVLRVSGKDIEAGVDLVVKTSQTNRFALTTLDTRSAVLCFNAAEGTLKCNAILLLSDTGSTLKLGGDLAVSPTEAKYISMATLSPSKTAVCYRDVGASDAGECAVVRSDVSTASANSYNCTAKVALSGVTKTMFTSTIQNMFKDAIVIASAASTKEISVTDISLTSIVEASTRRTDPAVEVSFHIDSGTQP